MFLTNFTVLFLILCIDYGQPLLKYIEQQSLQDSEDRLKFSSEVLSALLTDPEKENTRNSGEEYKDSKGIDTINWIDSSKISSNALLDCTEKQNLPNSEENYIDKPEKAPLILIQSSTEYKSENKSLQLSISEAEYRSNLIDQTNFEYLNKPEGTTSIPENPLQTAESEEGNKNETDFERITGRIIKTNETSNLIGKSNLSHYKKEAENNFINGIISSQDRVEDEVEKSNISSSLSFIDKTIDWTTDFNDQSKEKSEKSIRENDNELITKSSKLIQTSAEDESEESTATPENLLNLIPMHSSSELESNDKLCDWISGFETTLERSTTLSSLDLEEDNNDKSIFSDDSNKSENSTIFPRYESKTFLYDYIHTEKSNLLDSQVVVDSKLIKLPGLLIQTDNKETPKNVSENIIAFPRKTSESDKKTKKNFIYWVADTNYTSTISPNPKLEKTYLPSSQDDKFKKSDDFINLLIRTRSKNKLEDMPETLSDNFFNQNSSDSVEELENNLSNWTTDSKNKNRNNHEKSSQLQNSTGLLHILTKDFYYNKLKKMPRLLIRIDDDDILENKSETTNLLARNSWKTMPSDFEGKKSDKFIYWNADTSYKSTVPLDNPEHIDIQSSEEEKDYDHDKLMSTSKLLSPTLTENRVEVKYEISQVNSLKPTSSKKKKQNKIINWIPDFGKYVDKLKTRMESPKLIDNRPNPLNFFSEEEESNDNLALDSSFKSKLPDSNIDINNKSKYMPRLLTRPNNNEKPVNNSVRVALIPMKLITSDSAKNNQSDFIYWVADTNYTSIISPGSPKNTNSYDELNMKSDDFIKDLIRTRTKNRLVDIPDNIPDTSSNTNLFDSMEEVEHDLSNWKAISKNTLRSKTKISSQQPKESPGLLSTIVIVPDSEQSSTSVRYRHKRKLLNTAESNQYLQYDSNRISRLPFIKISVSPRSPKLQFLLRSVDEVTDNTNSSEEIVGPVVVNPKETIVPRGKSGSPESLFDVDDIKFKQELRPKSPGYLRSLYPHSFENDDNKRSTFSPEHLNSSKFNSAFSSETEKSEETHVFSDEILNNPTSPYTFSELTKTYKVKPVRILAPNWGRSSSNHRTKWKKILQKDKFENSGLYKSLHNTKSQYFELEHQDQQIPWEGSQERTEVDLIDYSRHKSSETNESPVYKLPEWRGSLFENNLNKYKESSERDVSTHYKSPKYKWKGLSKFRYESPNYRLPKSEELTAFELPEWGGSLFDSKTPKIKSYEKDWSLEYKSPKSKDKPEYKTERQKSHGYRLSEWKGLAQYKSGYSYKSPHNMSRETIVSPKNVITEWEELYENKAPESEETSAYKSPSLEGFRSKPHDKGKYNISKSHEITGSPKRERTHGYRLSKWKGVVKHKSYKKERPPINKSSEWEGYARYKPFERGMPEIEPFESRKKLDDKTAVFEGSPVNKLPEWKYSLGYKPKEWDKLLRYRTPGSVGSLTHKRSDDKPPDQEDIISQRIPNSRSSSSDDDFYNKYLPNMNDVGKTFGGIKDAVRHYWDNLKSVFS